MADQIRIACEGAETRELDELLEFQGNLKQLSKDNYAKLRKEILELGFSEPISVWQQDGQCHILNGHQRVRTLKHMRDQEGYQVPALPVSRVEAADAHEARRKVLALTSQYGEITEDGLYEFMHEAEIGIDELQESFRFPEIKLDRFQAGYFEDVQEDEPPSVQEEAVTQRGELIKLGRHRLMCVDALRNWPEQHFHVCITDPPYNVGREYGDQTDDNRTDYEAWSKEWFKAARANSDRLAFSCGHPNIVMWAHIEPWQWMLCWYKPNAMLGSPVGFSHWEPVLLYGKPDGPKGIDTIVASIRIEPELDAHECPKPVEFMSGLVRLLSSTNESIVDPFLGSGTTLIAAEQLDRICYGMEIEPRYCDVTVRRYYNLVGWDKAPAEHLERWGPKDG